MRAGAARIDITPTRPIKMEGMLRAHPSGGVHDPIFACALVMSNDDDLKHGCAIVSADVCWLVEPVTTALRNAVAASVGIPIEHIILAAKHIHSGPVTWGDGEVEAEVLPHSGGKTGTGNRGSRGQHAARESGMCFGH